MRNRKPNPNKERARALAKEIGALSDTERAAFAAESPVATIDGRILSLGNIALVKRQAPTATMVGGFRQWLAGGRCVKQGEQALYIWIPSTRRADPDKQEGEAGAGDTETRFLLAPVFDVSQTVETVDNQAAA